MLNLPGGWWLPDVPIVPTIAGIARGADEVRAKSIEVVKSRRARPQ